MAFTNKLGDEKDRVKEDKKVRDTETSKRIFLQRQTRVLNDLYTIFFSAECQKFYKPLLKLKVDQARMISIDE